MENPARLLATAIWASVAPTYLAHIPAKWRPLRRHGICTLDSFDGGERPRDRLEGPTLRRDTPYPLDHAGRDHQHRSDQIADEHAHTRAARDQPPEQKRTRHA